MIRAWLLPIVCLLPLLAQPAIAQRSSSYSSRYDTSVAMVDLRFGQENTDVRFSDGDTVTDFENGFLLVDILGEFVPHTLGGGRFGWSTGSGNDRDATQGMNMRGYTLGVVIGGQYPLAGENVSLLAGGHVQFTDTFGDTERQETDYSWWSLLTRLGVTLHVKRVSLTGGATYRYIDGKERTRGDIDRTTSFTIDRRDSAFIELDLNSDPGGHVGVSLEGGGTNAWHFYFRRFF
ncbi:MAG: hypothetical protein OET44_16975 [Gammaproteobacteria bacterium]|nr:hypothetical protein [Gammaproteobacteria bacterium]